MFVKLNGKDYLCYHRQVMTMVQVDRMMEKDVDNTRTPSGEVSATGVKDEPCSSLNNTEILLPSMDNKPRSSHLTQAKIMTSYLN